MGTKLLATLDELTSDVRSTAACLRSYNEEKPCPCPPTASVQTIVEPRAEISSRVPLLAGSMALHA